MSDTKFVADGSSGNKELEVEILEIMGEAFEIWKQRQRKYSATNISAFGEIGCLVRGFDKISRLRQALINNTGIDVPDESVSDSWLDLINYALMGLMCRRGK